MKPLRFRIAAAAIWSGVLVSLAVSASPAQDQQQTAIAAQAPSAQAQAPKASPPAQTKALRDQWKNMGIRGFSVALVLGDLAGAATPDNLPAGAKKALSDMRDFLPYKSYRLLDTHWILCCSGGYAASVAGRLRGTEEDEYSFHIDAHPPSPDSAELAVRFSLREAVTAEHAVTTVASADRARQATELKRERQDVEKRAREGSREDQIAARAKFEEIRRKIEELERASTIRSGRVGDVLDSTFTMKVGETVVIGTSRLKGDKALIALLTAASRNSAPSERR